MKKLVFNLETGKIELHFDKAEYMALPEEAKRELKSNYLFSGKSSAWVSRAKEPNLYHARRVAEKLGFTEEVREGVRLSFAEQMERKAERAEARAERFEQYAANAEKRGASLQAELNSYRGDIAFFTQPIIRGHAGSEAFANRRQRIFDRYEKGFDEYRKSEYFQSRAAIARETAEFKKLSDPVYLHNRIKECQRDINAYSARITKYEEILFSLENQTEEKPSPYNYSPDDVRLWLEDTLERLEAEIDKQGYFENALEQIGGIAYSQDNIKVGYIVKMRRWGRCEIVSAGPVNVSFKILDGGAAGGVLTEPYAAIAEILAVKDAPKVTNPYRAGDILCKFRPADGSIYKAYQVVKVTETGVKLQEIAVKNGRPIPDSFISSKQTQKKVVKSKFSDFVGVYMDDWQLHKYEQKELAGAV